MFQTLREIATRIRIRSIQITTTAGSGHPTSSCSSADILSVLFFNVMKYEPSNPRNPASDRFVLSKGHACPALYAAWAEVGHVPIAELSNVRKLQSDLEGHPTPRLDFIDVATGSLGMGLSFACGMAYMGKYFDKSTYRVYCLMGDGEVAEGGVWEAFHWASHYQLDNLVAIIDCNRLGQSQPTSLQHDVDTYRNRISAFGWNAIVCDGLNVEKLVEAFNTASSAGNHKPTCLIAKTFKGAGIPGIEDQEGWHGKPLPADKAASVIEHLKSQLSQPLDSPIDLRPSAPSAVVPALPSGPLQLAKAPQYKLGEQVATRNAYGTGLRNLGEHNVRVLALDGDVKNSTMSLTFQKAFPDRFIECYIAEQNMVGVAVGLAVRDRATVFVSTFAAFFARAYDHLRMAAVSFSNINLCGSHVGCAIGQDGPSQMALEDLAMFRAIPHCTVFYPSDAVSCERAVELAANTPNMTFIRTTRGNTPVIYSPQDTHFQIGKAHVLRSSPADQVTIVAAGVTLFEALRAADELSASGVHVRVIDPFTVKPIDQATLIEAARVTGGRVVTVEDHYPEGGLGDAVLGALAEQRCVVKKLAVTDIPRSGTPEELLDVFGIGTKAIVHACRQLLA